MTTIDFINKKLALGTVISQVFILLLFFYFVFFFKKQKFIFTFIGKHGMLLAFIIALASTAGSLFYSQYVGFDPCELCWLQRIFMYPLVVLLGLALIKKDRNIVDYALSLSLIGFLIALYQNFMYFNNGGLNALCETFGIGVSCVKRYVFEFGYVTIPMMALTAFSLIIIFLMISKTQKIK